MADSNTTAHADNTYNLGEFLARLDTELQAISEAQASIFEASAALAGIGRMMTSKVGPGFGMASADINDAARVFTFFGKLIWAESECVTSALDGIEGARHG